jgi:SP family sugar:H+ symporter-like MFS transporter
MLYFIKAYYAAHDQDDRGKASLRRVNGNVEGYDVDAEYAIIKNTILEERKELDALEINDKSTRQLLHSYIECFKGKNACVLWAQHCQSAPNSLRAYHF